MNLIRALKRDDRAAVVLFNDTVQLKEGLTSDIRRLESAIRALRRLAERPRCTRRCTSRCTSWPGRGQRAASFGGRPSWF